MLSYKNMASKVLSSDALGGYLFLWNINDTKILIWNKRNNEEFMSRDIDIL